VAGLFGGIASVLFAWAGFGLIFIGPGLFIRHLFGLKVPNVGGVFAAFWIGWAFAILFLQLWNLQFKVDWRPLVILTTGSAAGVFRSAPRELERFRHKLSTGRSAGFMFEIAASN
jgi:hypothetical protein